MRDYNNGNVVGDKIVKLAKQERQSLADQVIKIGEYGVGLVAGIGQLTTDMDYA
ncbi:hypothetical protein AAIA71_28510 (plasmid) [Vibrio harveyi]|uniref:hypothetical protein n=1 Tax=Vibrio harveyi TaxID=669 RepID=UPI00247FCDED|nr:hypothetical protein [Vibrio harveyi]